MVKRVLRRYGYPPDKQENATRTVLEQAEVLSAVWGFEPADELALGVDEEHLRAVAEAPERYEPFEG